MATLLYTFIGITAGASLHCAVRREISPCTCAPHESFPNTIQVTCEKLDSFNQVVDALQDRFAPESSIWLRISYSQLQDLGTRSFAEMNMNLINLRLNYNNISSLPVSAFRGLTKTAFLSLSDNNFEEIPREIFTHMPNIGTLDFARGRIQTVHTHEFKALSNLKHLVLAANQITKLEGESFPSTIVNLHVGKNNLTSLNGTIRNLPNLKILFVNSNDLTTLEGELPPNSPSLMMILAQFNRIEYLPSGFRTLPNLDSLYFNNNELKTFGGNLKHASKLKQLYASFNHIRSLAEDEFEEAENVEEFQISFNFIRSLNNSLLPMKKLRTANISNNFIEEFSLKEIQNLRYLRVLDLSYNRIAKLSGNIENKIEPNSLIIELHLENNLLRSLDGALMGLNKLKTLILSNNHLERIAPEDFIGLEELKLLDLSFNRLKTLEETSKTFLPSLAILNASSNLLTSLQRDFHGLPVLCLADLSNNMISTISTELVANTRCTNRGVPNKLEIILQENPVLCDDNLPQLITEMELQQARLLGVAHCIVPQSIDLNNNPILLQSQQPIVPIVIKTEIPITNLSKIMHPPPSIVQVIVPIAAPFVPVPEALVQPQENLTSLPLTLVSSTTTPPSTTTTTSTSFKTSTQQPDSKIEQTTIPSISESSENITTQTTIVLLAPPPKSKQTLSLSPITESIQRITTTQSTIIENNKKLINDEDFSITSSENVTIANNQTQSLSSEELDDPPEIVPDDTNPKVK